MKKSAAGIVLSLFLLLPALTPAQNWYLSTDLGERVEDIGAVDGDNV